MREDSGQSGPAFSISSTQRSRSQLGLEKSYSVGERSLLGGFDAKRHPLPTLGNSTNGARKVRRQIELWMEEIVQDRSSELHNELLIEKLSPEWRFRGSWVSAGLCAIKLAAEIRDRSSAPFRVALEMAVTPFSFELPRCLGIAQIRACLAWRSPKLSLLRLGQQPECGEADSSKLGYTSTEFTFIDDVTIRSGQVFSWMQAESLEFITRMYLFA